MSLKLFGYSSIREKVEQEKQWMKNGFSDCPIKYDPEAKWIDNAVICRLSLLKAYCDKFGIYQILNQEFNDALAKEIKKHNLKPVLEVGAGSGDLARAMRSRGIQMYAVDTFDQPLPERALNLGDLPEKMDYKEAIDKYKPELIICSWMPPGEDWTPVFRASESVKAYILIGEVEECGTDNTYGEFPGWNNYVLKGPNKWSMCRSDKGLDFDQPEIWWRHSKVIIYKRDPHAAFGGIIRKMKKCQGDPVDFRSERSTE